MEQATLQPNRYAERGESDGNGDPTTTCQDLQASLSRGRAVGNQNVSVNFADTTRFGTNFKGAPGAEQATAPSKLAGFSVGRDGSLMARYTNGQTGEQGTRGTGNFTNPQGCSRWVA